MPSFDIVSKVDAHELTNAVDQTARELATRFDFKGSGARIEKAEETLTLVAASEFQIKQIFDILQTRMAKRGIDVRCLDCGPVQTSVNEARQSIQVQQGIDKELARSLVKAVKDTSLKVQAAIQGDQLRVSGKKRDDLQGVIAVLRGGKFSRPLQFVNFRD